jgi:hypothetical protein
MAKAANDITIGELMQGYDLRLMPWEDGLGVPTSDLGRVIAGTDSDGLLHIRIFDAAGRCTDTFETGDSSGALRLVTADASGTVLSDKPESSLPAAQADAIAALKQQLPGLLASHVLNIADRGHVLSEVTSITGHIVMQGLDHGGPGEDVRRLPGFRKLAAIGRREFSADLDWRTLDLLLGLLCTSQMMGSDEVDNLPLGQAASKLKTAAERLPTRRLIDGRHADCIKCGRPLAIEERAWQRGLCDDCHRPEDKVLSLDTAFRTEARDYNEWGRDPLDRFPEWHAISNEICKRYNISKVERDHWERFLNECEADLEIGRESLLGMRRADLVARFVRPDKPPPADPAGSQAPRTPEGTSGGQGRKRGQPLTRDQEESGTKNKGNGRTAGSKAGQPAKSDEQESEVLTPDDLPPTAWNLLKAMLKAKAIDPGTAKTREEIVAAAGTGNAKSRKDRPGNANSKHVRDAFRAMKALKLIGTKKKTGTWLTEGGLHALKSRQ